MFVSRGFTGSTTTVTPADCAIPATNSAAFSNCSQAWDIGQPAGTCRDSALPQLMTFTPTSAARATVVSRYDRTWPHSTVGPTTLTVAGTKPLSASIDAPVSRS